MMNKIRCPRCGVINLEKFVTYPHCAGCGSILPQVAGVAEHQPIWRRPLGPVLWVTVIAGAVAILVVTATMFENTPVELERVVVYGRAARSVELNRELVIYLTLDTMDTAPTQQTEMIKDVNLRISRSTLNQFEFVSLAPPPDGIMRAGSGRYLQYKLLPRETQIELTLRPRQVGTHAISIGVYASDRYPAVPYNLTVGVTAPARRTAPPPESPR